MATITATITGINLQASHNGGEFYYVFFRGEDGESYRTHVCPDYRNYARWKDHIAAYEAGQSVTLCNLVVKPGTHMVNADSAPQRV